MKKGYNFITNIAGYMVFAFIVIIFFILASHTKTGLQENVARGVSVDNTKTDLLVFLRHPLSNGGPIASEIIIDGEYDILKRNYFKNLAIDTFDEKYGPFWNLEVKYPNGKQFFVGHRHGSTDGNLLRKFQEDVVGNHEMTVLNEQERIKVETVLPSYNEGTIKVSLQQWVVIY